VKKSEDGVKIVADWMMNAVAMLLAIRSVWLVNEPWRRNNASRMKLAQETGGHIDLRCCQVPPIPSPPHEVNLLM
jgi:hypothetical protein